jgi:acyl-CoA thioesterase-1
MNWLTYTFGSGLAFFLGLGLILTGLTVFTVSERSIWKILATCLAVLGLCVVGLSAAPLPYWFYALAAMLSGAWLIAERLTQSRLYVWRRLLRGLIAVVCLIAVAMELPYHLSPSLHATGKPTLYILADSVTAGTGEKITWPKLLAKAQAVDVVDLSMAGATVNSALKQADGVTRSGGIVLLEIGGNDLLGETSVADYELDLERLLQKVCQPGRAVLMFELPLPPFRNEYGRVQRRLAAKHHVTMIPKRLFMGVLSEPGATIDSVHLAHLGHERMSAIVWAFIQPAYRE